MPKSRIGRAVARIEIGRLILLGFVVLPSHPALHLLEDVRTDAETETSDDRANEDFHVDQG